VSDGAQISIQRFSDLSFTRVVQDLTITTVGAPGQSGASPAVFGTAGAVISGDRAIAFANDGRLVHANSSDAAHAGAYAGISLGAAQVNAQVQYQRTGTLTAGFWTWTPGLVFVGLDGQLTQVPPTSGYVLAVGWAVNATTIDLKPGVPYLRS